MYPSRVRLPDSSFPSTHIQRPHLVCLESYNNFLKFHPSPLQIFAAKVSSSCSWAMTILVHMLSVHFYLLPPRPTHTHFIPICILLSPHLCTYMKNKLRWTFSKGSNPWDLEIILRHTHTDTHTPPHTHPTHTHTLLLQIYPAVRRTQGSNCWVVHSQSC